MDCRIWIIDYYLGRYECFGRLSNHALALTLRSESDKAWLRLTGSATMLRQAQKTINEFAPANRQRIIINERRKTKNGYFGKLSNHTSASSVTILWQAQ